MNKVYNCEICGEEYSKQKLSLHIRLKHNISLEDYYKLYILKNSQFDNTCLNESCTNKTEFLNIFRGYRKFCSNKCSTTSEYLKSKIEKSFINKFGVDNPMKCNAIKEKQKDTLFLKYGVEHNSQMNDHMSKVRKTFLEKYGVEWNSKDKSFISKRRETNIQKFGGSSPSNSEEIKEKIKKTCINKYGVDNPMKNDYIKEKVINTSLIRYGSKYYLGNEENLKRFQKIIKEKYGVDNVSKLKETKEKLKNINLKNMYERLLSSERLLSRCIPLFQVNNYIGVNNKYLWKCCKCNLEFFDNVNNGHIPRCLNCHPYLNGSSNLEKEVLEFCKKYYNGNIIENDRIVLGGKELDIYIPSKKLAIEFNGLYWHSDEYCERYYHLNKTNFCLKKDIKLIHIFEDEWLNKQDIVKSIILSRLNNIDKKIYARECELREVSKIDSDIFLDNNHLQGTIHSELNVGLYFENELCSLMSIGRPRFNKKYKWEILRFCSKNYTICVGGLSKIFSYLIKTYKLDFIITYADLRYGTGDSYKNIGFKFLHKSKPNYFYIKDRQRYNRLLFQKKLLENKLDVYDENLTEWENMQLNDYSRIFDCGCNVFEYIS